MTQSRWAQQWPVQGSTGTLYTVSIDHEGHWACGCRGWTMHMPRRDCKHIREVQGRASVQALLNTQAGATNPPPFTPPYTAPYASTYLPNGGVTPEIAWSNVQVTTFAYGVGAITHIEIPMPADEHMLWTIAYDLELAACLPLATIVETLGLPPGTSANTIRDHIETCGRKLYQAPRTIDATTTKIVPCGGNPAPEDWAQCYGTH